MNNGLQGRGDVHGALRSGRMSVLALVVATMVGCTGDDKAMTLPVADKVFENGKVYTVDQANRTFSAIAIKDGKILALGSDDDIDAYVNDATEVVDLGGKMLMPGLIDSHVHPAGGGNMLSQCSLEYKAWTVDEILNNITACLDGMKDEPDDKWLRVGGWMRQATKPEGADLSAKILDRLPTNRPVVVVSSSGHSTVANSVAMRVAGITKDTADPKGGSIVHDANGDVTGMFIDAARGMILDAIPKLSDAAQKQKNLANLAGAVQALSAEGVTSILDALVADEAAMQIYNELQKTQKLTVRAHLAYRITPDAAEQPQAVVDLMKTLANKYNSPIDAQRPEVDLDRAKIFVDGVIQAPAKSGALIKPYLYQAGSSENPHWQPSDHSGSLYFDEPLLTGMLDVLVANGFSAQMHTDGDGAVQTALNAVETIRGKHPDASFFHPGLAHCELVDPSDFARFAELNSQPVLSFQWGKPAADTIDSVKDYMGPERFGYVETAGKFHVAGARVAFGSDWPVDGLDEWLAMQIAVTRENPDQSDPKYHGRLGDDPGLDIQTAIRAFTINAAYQINMAEHVGSLEVGKFADLIVIDQDLTAIDPHKIGDTNVLLTLVGGRETHRAPAFR